MDGALEFDEQGRESNSNMANNGFHNQVAPASGDSFLWVLSLSVQRKYLASSGSEITLLLVTTRKLVASVKRNKITIIEDVKLLTLEKRNNYKNRKEKEVILHPKGCEKLLNP